MILLAEAANRTKKGGQELIGGLDVRVERNHFGRQTESFETDLGLAFLSGSSDQPKPFRGIFIRAPVVQRVLPQTQGVQADEEKVEGTIVAPSKASLDATAAETMQREVIVQGKLRPRGEAVPSKLYGDGITDQTEAGKIVAVQQWNVFGTSFHPELTGDARVHEWWLREILPSILARRGCNSV